MNSIFPTFPQIREFLIANPRSTIYQLCVHFEQKGDDTLEISSGKFAGHVFAYKTTNEFVQYLQRFIAQPYVKVEYDAIGQIISDPFIGKKYLPVLLSIYE